MRFLLDESADFRLALHLRAAGHDVTAIGHDYPSSLDDPEVLAIAHRERRILITDDRDFGELVFERRHSHAGVIFLRLGPVDLATKISRLDHVLSAHAADLDRFIVVTRRSVRVTWLP